MDYKLLVDEFFYNMIQLKKAKPFKELSDGMHGESFVLFYLLEKKGKEVVIPSDISLEMGLSTARIAAALGSLESKGYITREIDTYDRRRIVVSLTADGEDVAKTQMQKHKDFLEGALRGLGEKDAKEYIRLSKRLCEKIGDPE